MNTNPIRWVRGRSTALENLRRGQHFLHPEDVDRSRGGLTRRHWNDAAVDEVAHNPVARRPVTAVTERVIAAEVAAVAHDLAATGTEAHDEAMCRRVHTLIGLSSPATDYALEMQLVGPGSLHLMWRREPR